MSMLVSAKMGAQLRVDYACFISIDAISDIHSLISPDPHHGCEGLVLRLTGSDTSGALLHNNLKQCGCAYVYTLLAYVIDF